MPEDFLARTFYGNTMARWLAAFAITLAALLVAKTLYWLSTKLLRRLTAKSRTKLDDVLLDMIEEPIVCGVAIGGLWFALRTLDLPEATDRFIGNVIQALVILSLVWLVARLLDSLYEHFLMPLARRSENDLDDQLLPILRRGTQVMVWSLGLIVALNNAGYEVGAVLAGVGIGGLALAMAAKDTISNIFGGVTIFTDRPFKINDRVKVAGFEGHIRTIGVRSTRLETLEKRMVTIPNSKFTDSAVENVTLEPSRKVVMDLKLTYDTDAAGMRRAMEILRELAAANDSLEDEIVVTFNELGDFGLNVRFIYYIKKAADIPQTWSEVNLAILERFAAAGLEFAFPTQTIYTIPQPSAGLAPDAPRGPRRVPD